MKYIYFFFIIIFLIGCTTSEPIKIRINPSEEIKIIPEEKIVIEEISLLPTVKILRLNQAQEEMQTLEVETEKNFNLCWDGIKGEKYQVTIGKNIESKEIWDMPGVSENCIDFTGKLEKGNYFLSVYAFNTEKIGKVNTILIVR